MNDLVFASNLAIEGQKYLLYRWQGEYGDGYPSNIRDSRCIEIENNLDRLRQIKGEAKDE